MNQDDNASDKIERWIASKDGEILTSEAYLNRQGERVKPNNRMSGSFFGLTTLLGRMTSVRPQDKNDNRQQNADVMYGNNQSKDGIVAKFEMTSVASDEYSNNPMSSPGRNPHSLKTHDDDGEESSYMNNPVWSMRLTRGSKNIDEVPTSPRVHSGEFFSNYLAYTVDDDGSGNPMKTVGETDAVANTNQGDSSARQPSLHLTGVNPISRLSTSYKVQSPKNDTV